MSNNRIPIFPLDLVLLPGKVLPLHIFEPRYRLMFGNLVTQNEPFGVVRAHENGIARVGCTAILIRVIKTYEDGRMDILTVGQMPFRIIEVHQEKPYLEATVELLSDDPENEATPLPAELRPLFEECYRLAHGAEPETTVQQNPVDRSVSVAYKLAAELPLELDELQELLELRSEPQRQALFVEQLRTLLPRLARIAQMRSLSAGNGHGLH